MALAEKTAMTILLVEDAQDLAQLIVRDLRAEGYDVLHAADGLAALDLFSRHEPDLVILDWMLPKLSGLEVLRRIRARSPVPILMLTARTEETDRVVGLEVGADDYLTKPFSMRELVARVRALLRRIEHVQQILSTDRRPEHTVLRYRGLALDPQDYRVTLDGVPLTLSRTEFDLLHLLLRNPGRAFNRTYLLDTVWGRDHVLNDRSVDSTILRLRKKLGPLGQAIEAVWGVGYRLRHA
jgi:DNA-binding response OmpR family regulator